VQAARVEELYRRLREVQIAGGVRVELEGQPDLYEVMLFPPASEPEIAAAQAWPGTPLPADFVQFWRFTNGANLYVNESGLHGVGVASTDLIAELQKEEAENYPGDALRGYCVFGRVNGAGDFLVFELASGQVLDGVHAEQPHEWAPIADSFSDWLDRLVSCDGRYYWLEGFLAQAET
jgi:hypothetical protein